MRSFVILAAGALLFAAAIVELSSRLWPDSHIALLIISAVVLFLQGWLGKRLVPAVAGPTQPAATTQPAGGQPARRENRGADRKDGNSGRDRGTSGGRADKPTRDKPAKDAPAAVSGDAESDGKREPGTVKWFNRSKGFGFVVRESGEEIFVHQRSIRVSEEGDKRRPSLRDGQAVTFVVAKRDKGLQAEDVAPAE